jgi:5'(3')-deoxyribonucleotidase
VKLFTDLDGCITAFNKQLEELLGHPVKEDFKDPKIWIAINKAGKKFWSTMKWMEDGHELWDAIEKYEPTILSSPSNHPSSVEGKKEWLKENLPDVPYIIEKHKEKYAGKDKILIDDREKNIEKWEKAGGIGILHKDAKSTIEKLNKIMDKTKKEASVDLPNKPIKKPWLPKDIRGGRPEKIIPSKKNAPYKRQNEKDWEKYIEASEKLRKIAGILNNL